MPHEKSKKKSWESFFEQCDKAGVPDNFMENRDRRVPQDRGDSLIFADDDSEPLTDEDRE